MTSKKLSYSDYLQLSKILDSQSLQSAQKGNLVHDEMLFIIIHQAYELWFKQILHELDSIIDMFKGDYAQEENTGTVVARLGRIIEIQKLLIDQVGILETMTPMDFLEFRDLLTPASGFQSVQFRQIENKLGMDADDRVRFGKQRYDEYLESNDRRRALESEKDPSLFILLENWLERTPFLQFEEFNFWESYQESVEKMIKRLHRLMPPAILYRLIYSPTLRHEDLKSESTLSAVAESFVNSLNEKENDGATYRYDILPEEEGSEFFIQITMRMHGIDYFYKLNQEFIDSTEYAKIRDLNESINDMMNDSAFIQRGEKKQPVGSFKDALEWLMGEAKRGQYIQRYKGLGEMNPDQLWETTMDPDSRRMLQVTVEDAIACDQLFTTLMGDQVEPRRAFIEQNALKVENLDV